MDAMGIFLFVIGSVAVSHVEGDNYVAIDLRYGMVTGYSPYISFLQTPTAPPLSAGQPCGSQAVVKVSLEGPYKGVKLELDYDEAPKLWTLDVADSPLSDGFGGSNDTGSPFDMAEVHVHNRQLRVYGNALPGYMEASLNGGHLLHVVDDVIKKGSQLWLDVSHRRLELGTAKGATLQDLESPYLFTLRQDNWTSFLQPAAARRRDSSLYVGLNRVVSVATGHRVGSGLCKVRLTLYELAKDCERGTHNCHKEFADCITSRRSYKCKCKQGFYGDGKVCVDYNECEYENGGCVHICHNTPGNFSCSCYPGFVLAPDGLDCIDENECERKKDGCSHQCVNTLGSFECRCRTGYSLHSDGKTCITGAWCRSVAGCEHHCAQSGGNRCACRDGYRLAPDGKKCLQTCAVGNGGCKHKCTDTPTGPLCSCIHKYILASDNRSCIPTCGVKNGGCEKKCRDTQSGPICSCPQGYRLHHDGASCLDNDECLEDKGGCSHECINTHGSYACVCPPGFKVGPDKKSCIDLDECAAKDTCDHMCHNTPGSYSCSCRQGYQKYGITHCADINECSVQNGGCQHDCSNTDGGYTCSCQTGFKLHPNGRDCVHSQQCLPLQAPALSTLECHGSAREQRCDLRCQGSARLTSLPGSQVSLTCGPVTHYQWKVEGYNTSSVPTCSETEAPVSYKRVAHFSFLMKRCEFRNSSLDELKTHLANALESQKRYKCKSMCQVNAVNVTCPARARTMRRLVRGSRDEVVTVEVEIQMNSKRPSSSLAKKCDLGCMASRTKKRFKRFLRKIKKAVLQTQFQIRFEGRDFWVVKNSFKTGKKMEEACGPGYVLVGKKCVACSQGTYFDSASGTCKACPAGTFQNREGMLKCKSCQEDAITGPPGAVSRGQCRQLCALGHFSSNGSVPCQPCPAGTFQPQAGRTSCVACGKGVTTSQTAASSFAHCRVREVCQPGHQYDMATGTCKACPTGTYQTESGQNFCTACPGATSTDYEASTSPDDCKDHICGEYQGMFYGIIRSPNYPGNYPNNVNCVWRIKPEKRRRILIIIPEIFMADGENCGDALVMRKSKSEFSRTTYETCVSRNTPIAFTARSKKLWIQFKSDGNATAAGFSIPFVAYNEEYQSLIEDIVKDGRLYSSYQHQQIFKDRELLHALLEVIATPYNYLKYANVSRSMFPHSFFRLLTPKVRKFFSN